MELFWTTLGSLASWLTHVLIEFSLFIAVDSVVKASLPSLREARERQWLWFLESVALLVLVLFLTLYDRTPYLLLLLTMATLVFALAYDWLKQLSDGQSGTQNLRRSHTTVNVVNSTVHLNVAS